MAPLEPEAQIDCIDCGGPCTLISYAPEMGWQPGDLATYRCRDCLDRWDLLLPDEGEAGGDAAWERG